MHLYLYKKEVGTGILLCDKRMSAMACTLESISGGITVTIIRVCHHA
jgi:hypothetical protein